MQRGLPRPKVPRDFKFSGFPVPYNATSLTALGSLDHDRDKEVSWNDLCQTCGMSFEDDEAGIGITYQGSTQILDNALLHDRCFEIALRWCPHLRANRASLDYWIVLPAHTIDYRTVDNMNISGLGRYLPDWATLMSSGQELWRLRNGQEDSASYATGQDAQGEDAEDQDATPEPAQR